MQVVITDATQLNSEVQKGDSIESESSFHKWDFVDQQKYAVYLTAALFRFRSLLTRVTLLGFRRMCGYRRAVMYWLSYVVGLYSLNDRPKPMELKLKVNKPRFQYCIQLGKC